MTIDNVSVPRRTWDGWGDQTDRAAGVQKPQVKLQVASPQAGFRLADITPTDPFEFGALKAVPPGVPRHRGPDPQEAGFLEEVKSATR